MRNNLGVITRRARDTCTRARTKLDVVDKGSGRNLAKRKTVTGLNRSILRDDERISYLHVLRDRDVATLTISEHAKCDERRAVRVVLNRLDASRDVVLVVLEIDIAETCLLYTSDAADE